MKDGQEIYQQEVAYIQVTDLNLIENGEDTYAVICYRHDGSANALYFEVVKLNADAGELIFTSDEYIHGLIETAENSITVEYPEYEADDVMTEASSFVVQDFSIEGAKVNAGEVQVTAAEEESKVSIQSENKYKNPSYSEINRLLT